MAGTDDRGKGRDKQLHLRRAAVLQPLRRRIVRLLADGREAGAAEVAAELGERLGSTGYHLRVLLRREVLKPVPRRSPSPPRYRLAPGAGWALELLAEIDEDEEQE